VVALRWAPALVNSVDEEIARAFWRGRRVGVGATSTVG